MFSTRVNTNMAVLVIENQSSARQILLFAKEVLRRRDCGNYP
ncbi:hypothetical protein ACPOL_3153 [Acidisarcina polymorpha]|uniref:Uncharacterized protein n=1 Tax=Acidisarcina polymorpha TaxID=2211140 RepID=A0A2Z5G002_9BACT|nr:hypothetical protein ACPOL_3153 [Acidisarcina polymorpha]